MRHSARTSKFLDVLTTRTLLALGLTAVLLTACAESDPSTVSLPTATPTASPSPVSTLPSGVDQLVEVTVRNGQVVGGAERVKVKLKSVVRLVVTSDVADEIHLHGYDETADITAGGTATLTFTASIPGVFEVELESAELVLARFQVQ
jgi:major membrane immunogen (membrane-anchored lipoprotein)